MSVVVATAGRLSLGRHRLDELRVDRKQSDRSDWWMGAADEALQHGDGLHQRADQRRDPKGMAVVGLRCCFGVSSTTCWMA